MNRSLSNIILAVTGSMIIAACGEKKKEAPNPASMPVPVNLYEVHPEKTTYFDRYPGTVVPMMQVDVRSVVDGYITGIFFTEGTHVAKGQKLYTIDDSKIRAGYNQAQANIRVAEANQEQAQKDADRYIYLNQHDAVAKQILDHALTTLANAKNQVTAAKQDLVKSQTDLGYSTIKSPFEGVIGISQVKLGNTVTPGQTVLNTISTDDPMAVDFVVNEKQIGRFIALQSKKSELKDSIFTLAMPDNTIYSVPGKVHVIDRGVNPQTGTIIVRLAFSNTTKALRAGMSCQVRVRNDDTAQQLVIPGKAIVEQMGEYFVFVARDTTLPADPNKKDNTPAGPSLRAVQKKVMVAQAIGDKVIVKSGLESGERVVVDGVQKLHDGSVLTLGGPAGAKPAGK